MKSILENARRPMMDAVQALSSAQAVSTFGVGSVLNRTFTTLMQNPVVFCSLALAAAAPVFLAEFLLLMSVLAETANGISHPADYTILSLTSRQANTGRYFSVHSFTGYIQFAFQ